MPNHHFTDFAVKNILLDLVTWLVKNNCWDDVYIYINNRRYAADNYGKYDYSMDYSPKGNLDNVKMYVKEDIKASDYIEYANDDTVTITFDGSNLYDIMNYEGYAKAEPELTKIFEKYHMYFEMGDAWNIVGIWDD